MLKKAYWNRKQLFPQRTDFSDGSAIIDYGCGEIVIIESESPYGQSNVFYRFDDFLCSLN